MGITLSDQTRPLRGRLNFIQWPKRGAHLSVSVSTLSRSRALRTCYFWPGAITIGQSSLSAPITHPWFQLPGLNGSIDVPDGRLKFDTGSKSLVKILGVRGLCWQSAEYSNEFPQGEGCSAVGRLAGADD